ncbi:MAG: 2-amino-4-hydroxy-6-hydroxymethyldihydropteridine diphosphokinase [Anaerolineae bacterium]|jgi:2-amino-4-hydroxy-6-hydroxymethyldihydropteridine diphosphokinase|nr:2-amino-4-hydroxy-6-hydroxymethyldihydropteridine diphosphokinase [Anaerolineae bacterium]
MGSQPRPVALLLGSNIAPEANLRAAVRELSSRYWILKTSQVWESPAMGGEGQDYLNMAVLILSQQDPAELKYGVLRPIETRLGRVRSRDKFAARPIDIDVVAQAGQALDPNLWKYAYAAVPVSEILPELTLPPSRERLAIAAERLRRRSPIRLHWGKGSRLALISQPDELSLPGTSRT